MAQRKSVPSAPKKTGTPAAAKATGARPPAKKKPGKSIVNQKQTPWSMIITIAVIVIFAGSIVGYVVANQKTTPKANGGCSAMIGSNKTTYLNELKCAADIQGVTFKAEPNRQHVSGVIQYDASPPVGGNHAPIWGDCSGTVYAAAIADENAVHMLEHGAIWITYQPGLAQSEITVLSQLVNGVDRMAMSPYPGLDTPISLQSWGYQLKVTSASDPRIQKFITALRYNAKTTPEFGASCSDPYFLQHLSTPGHPTDQ